LELLIPSAAFRIEEYMALVQTRRLNPVCWHVELGEVRQ
jgi:hypothetical protein